MNENLTAIVRRIGRRGTSLLFFALVDVGVAVRLLIADKQPAGANASYRGMAAMLPLEVWGYVWLASAALLAAGAFLKKDRLPFTAAMILKVAWALGFFISWRVYDIPLAWLGSIIYGAFAGFVLSISGWLENDDRQRREPAE